MNVREFVILWVKIEECWGDTMRWETKAKGKEIKKTLNVHLIQKTLSERQILSGRLPQSRPTDVKSATWVYILHVHVLYAWGSGFLCYMVILVNLSGEILHTTV